MHEPLFTNRLAKSNFPFKFEKYWQSVLRFGLPLVVWIYGANYAFFRLANEGHPAPYDWAGTLVSAAITMPLMSAIWWLLMREIAAWKRKNQLGADGGTVSATKR